MAFVAPRPATPRAPSPKVHIMKEVMEAFGKLALLNDLKERSDFCTLFRILDDALIADSLLRSLYIEFLREGRMELQVRFIINWRIRAITVETALGYDSHVILTDHPGDASGADYLLRVSSKLFGLYNYVQTLIVENEYDEATWTIELRGDDRNRAVADRARALEMKYGLVEPTSTYLKQRSDLEKSSPVRATFRKKSLPELLLYIIHRG
jgi:hypothetical protein